MKFVIQINAGPNLSQAGMSALNFIEAALAAKHEIVRVFFYSDGIDFGFRHATPPNDEYDFGARWSRLAEAHAIDLVICVSAAQRRGLLAEDEAHRLNKQDNDLAAGFRISGLGQLLDAAIHADRYLVFG